MKHLIRSSAAPTLGITVLALGLLIASRTSLPAQGTAFGYQGRLNNKGQAATGLYDMAFSLFDAAAAGTSLAGPLMLGAVPVTNGLFSVRLDFGPNQFTGPGRWLEIQVRTNGNGSYETLAPRQPLLPAPYAIFAGAASNVVGGSVVTRLNGLRDQVNLAAGQNVTITPNGNTLTISSLGTGGNGIWSANGNNTYFLAGNVGIGTASPTDRLAISGGPLWTANGWIGSVELDDISAIAWHANSAGQRFGIGHTSGGLFMFRTSSDPADTSKPAIYDLTLDNSGRLGLGTVAPSSQFHVAGYQPVITLEDSNAGLRTAIQGVDGAINLFSADYLLGPTFGNPYGFLTVGKSGNVGIGSALPLVNLDIRGSGVTEATIWSVDERAILSLHSTAQGMDRVWTLESGLYGTAGLFGIYDRTAGRARLTIDTAGTVGVDVLQIRGGADLSEHFDVTPAALDVAQTHAKSEPVQPGMVVCIDPENPGKLVVSTQPYDERVAGIISGAGGIKPGMLMGQNGSVADGALPVALSGRVYCLADASYGAIAPGNLLTTSGTPGHAMGVRDHEKAHGAVLGKAMTSLKEGKGMVLVLVTLQ